MQMVTIAMNGAVVVVLLLAVPPALNQVPLDHPLPGEFVTFLAWINDFLGVITTTDINEAYNTIAMKKKVQTLIPDEVPFPCDLSHGRSPVKPTSVDEVRPGDIDVIGAIGDSLTTANGAGSTNVFQVATEYRGVSWSIGGEATWRKYLTLPNMLKEYNPNLIGFSVNSSHLAFNTAVLATIAKDIPAMAKYLVKRMREEPQVDMKNDWKMVTLMIGSNDICSNFCFLGDIGLRLSPGHLRQRLTYALTYLMRNMPRTIVNIVIPPVMDDLHMLFKKRFGCRTMYAIECPCFFGEMRRNSIDEMSEVFSKWITVFHEVAAYERFRTNEFAVIIQPFTLNRTVAKVRDEDGEEIPDLTLFAEDCFHPSQRGHAASANALWNNMFEPIGRKSLRHDYPFERIICPSEEHPYIFTYRNSPRGTIALTVKSLVSTGGNGTTGLRFRTTRETYKFLANGSSTST